MFEDRLRELSRRLDAIEHKLDRMWAHLDFIRTRIGSYVGDGIALTYTVGGAPILVNANDIGGPSNLLNGGRYEQENLEVLLSFVRDDTIFVDIGANIGYFPQQIGPRVFARGKIYAFEPHPKLVEILRRNVYINNLTRVVSCYPLALSDKNETGVVFHYPCGHLGGGQIGDMGEVAGHTTITAEVRRLDDVLGVDFRCDLVKIDVEGHEINVLNGMTHIVGNSPQIKILFEKLLPHSGIETALETYFREKDFVLYGVHPGAVLVELAPGALHDWSGYVLAARPGTIEGGLNRSRFSVYPGQLFVPGETVRPTGALRRRVNQEEFLFHGPYWFISKGIWRLKVHGEIRGILSVTVMEEFGHPVLHFRMEAGQSEFVFTLPRDLVHFECAARATGSFAEVSLDRLEFIREG
jgi:FkbM family methyltransferase